MPIYISSKTWQRQDTKKVFDFTQLQDIYRDFQYLTNDLVRLPYECHSILE